jgi:hypothetical protein
LSEYRYFEGEFEMECGAIMRIVIDYVY